MRFLLFALLPILAVAQPTEGNVPGADSTQPTRRNSLSLQAGGSAVAVGVQYERSIGGPFRLGIGYGTATVGDLSPQRSHIVPVTVAAIRTLRGAWGADLGVGATVALTTAEAESYVIPGTEVLIENEAASEFRVVLSGTAGFRYEGRRFYGRAGAALLASPPYQGRGWVVFPWPAVGAGVRF